MVGDEVQRSRLRALIRYLDVPLENVGNERARILIGYLPDGTPVSSKMILTSGGRASQLYGGLTDEGSKARSGHFFEWEAIVRSKAAGATLFAGRVRGGYQYKFRYVRKMPLGLPAVQPQKNNGNPSYYGSHDRCIEYGGLHVSILK